MNEARNWSRPDIPLLRFTPADALDLGSFHVVEDGAYDSSYYSAFYRLLGRLVGEIFVDGVGQLGDGEGLEPDSSRAGERR